MKIFLLSGGIGKRLFPLSREQYPKQFIPFFNGKSLIQLTLERFKTTDDIYIITTKVSLSHVFHLKKSTEIEFKTIFEPYSKNTTASIVYGLQFLDDDDIVGVFPVDHLIENKNLFQKNIEQAIDLANNNIVLIGIEPTRPDTRFGYFEYKNNEVISFKEKPDLNLAKEYVKSGKFLWNSGIFIFKKKVMMEQIKLYQPEIYSITNEIRKLLNKQKFDKNNFLYPEKNLERLFNKYPSISIDYAIIEKTKKLKAIKANFDWDDLGNFDSLFKKLPSISKLEYGVLEENYRQEDKSNRNLFFQSSVENSQNSIIGLKDKMYGIIGYDNCKVIDNEDILLIIKNGESDKIDKFYQCVEKEYKDLNILKFHKSVLKPWGYYKNLYEKKENYLVKLIKIEMSQQISLQKHQFRDEYWIIVEGSGIIIINNKKYKVKKGKQFFIPANTLHQAIASKKENLIFIEVQLGTILSENDIIRIKDKYKR